MLSATVERFGGGAPTKHRVRDLSPGGIRIDQATELRPGATVLIWVGILEAVGATVKWVAEGCAGLAFAEEIDPEHARARASSVPRPVAATAPVQASAPAPGAGWITDMQSPYRT
ncbi:PilZ domain-containing protein [Sphingomonas oligophenolica]|uniref:PilZ domain-containing protein n=2 Tax=Sphingomonas oligophenolica TaxID=301154 RepID=A0A502BRR9_9SPHN|nr:PilZ domain-containing protein [Sphingomonas oligophenolica]